jgi:uncharacterized protein YegP (UPF0339 family)
VIRFKVTKGGDGLWYWHAKAGNGRIRADGGEGYTRKRDATKELKGLLAKIAAGKWEIV